MAAVKSLQLAKALSQVVSQSEEGSSKDGVSLSDRSQRTSQSAFSCSVYSKSEFANAPLQASAGGMGFFRRIPCKARGVPGEHVAMNAYVDIPLDAKHGTVLSCSHPACRRSGRLFRFCAVCQVPVAKRNFARRHAHGLDISDIVSSESENGFEQPRPRFKECQPKSGDSPTCEVIKSFAVTEPVSVSRAWPMEDSSATTGHASLDTMIATNSGTRESTETNSQLAMSNLNSMPTCSSPEVTRALPACENGSRKRELDERITTQVTSDELDWLYLFRQKPGINDSKRSWLMRVEQVVGFQILERNGEKEKKMRNQGEDDVLSDIEVPMYDLANFDESNLEDLFE